jgi:hypothetical protein
MRTARIGVVVGYLLLVCAVISVYLLGRFSPDVGKLAFAAIFSGIVLISGAVAFAVFSGSVVCATRALIREQSARRLSGLLTFVLSVSSALALFGLCVWAMAQAH